MPNITELFYGEDLRIVRASMKRCGGGVYPVGSNTLPTTPDILQPISVTKLADIFAPLQPITSLVSLEPLQPKTKRLIKITSAGSTTLVDTTNFEQGNGTIDGLEVVLAHYSQPWQVSNVDLNSGIRKLDLFYKNAEALAATLMAQVSFLFSTGAFPTAPIVKPIGAFGLSDAAAGFALLPGPKKALLLSSAAFANLSHGSATGFNSGDAVHGWKNGIWESNVGWPAHTYGIGIIPPAIVACVGFLTPFNVGNIKRSIIGLPGLDLMLEYNEWFNPQTRTNWQSLDCVFGVTNNQSDGAILFKDQ